MNDSIIKEIDETAIKLSDGMYAVIKNGRMLILEKINVYGTGYRTIVSFGYSDFEKLKKLDNNPFGNNDE